VCVCVCVFVHVRACVCAKYFVERLNWNICRKIELEYCEYS